jgi:hypothetical protein
VLPESARAEIFAGTARRLYPKLAHGTAPTAASSSGS